MTNHWLFWALLSAVFAALTAILTKLGLHGVDSDIAQLVRTVVVVLAIGAAILALGKWRAFADLNTANWIYLVLAGLATGASWACYFRALKVGEVARVAAVDKLSVVFVAIFAAVLLSERLSPVGWLGVALAGTGAVLLSIGK
ncbi:MAG: EamA family transporter [Planctomycetota bacterium]|nr:EamA family transporter [Planctomycetota bacterium]